MRDVRENIMSGANVQYVVETGCKMWDCPACGPKVLSAVKMRMEYGCLRQKHLLFITLTFRKEFDDIRESATSVGTAWRRWLYYLKKLPQWKTMTWFKVIEVTKKGQPHLHLLVGGISLRKEEAARDAINAWMRATSFRSYIVDVQAVLGESGAAAYLSKYMAKGLQGRKDLQALGFSRRWSRSRNWPSPGDLKLKGIVDDRLEVLDWTPATRHYGKEILAIKDRSETSTFLERTGDDLALALGDKRARKSLSTRIRRFLKDATNTAVPNGTSPKHS